ncbi:ABC transporter permease [Vibrio palustris]|uniref:Arginine ABC transporter permease protein ArtM n=1 Tax=Vibrio palustris TaxID=1918946 RepID=A0A1R4B1V5_9VIBR|nr:ABC transporter permease [Vibrio palustris]SJL82895.1 Histidine transport system permease protein HisM [Vibrio palustris]
MDFSVIIENLPLYLQGMWTTAWLVGASLVLGIVVAIPLALCRNSHLPLLRWPAWTYIYYFRGTPLLIQLYLIYYGMNQFVKVEGTWWEDAWFCALVSFVLNTSAYTAEIIRGAINGLPAGEVEAGRAFGMSTFKVYQRIILPGALRRALPAYSNEVIFMLHGSAVAGIITIMDLTGAARLVNARYYAPFEAFLTAGIGYMCLSFTLIGCFKLAEKKYLSYLNV